MKWLLNLFRGWLAYWPVKSIQHVHIYEYMGEGIDDDTKVIAYKCNGCGMVYLHSESVSNPPSPFITTMVAEVNGDDLLIKTKAPDHPSSHESSNKPT